MNIHMSNVTFNGPFGEHQNFSFFFIQGKQIRFVHIPDELNIIEAIKSQLNVIRGVRSYKETVPQKKLLEETRMLRNKIIREKTESISLSSSADTEENKCENISCLKL